MVFELSAIVLASSLLFVLYVQIFHPQTQWAVPLFHLVKCEVGDEPIGERTVALFVVEQGFELDSNNRYFVDDGVTDFGFSRPDLDNFSMLSTSKRHLLEIRYDYFPNADPGPKTVTARDMARFERAGFRPAGSCQG